MTALHEWTRLKCQRSLGKTLFLSVCCGLIFSMACVGALAAMGICEDPILQKFLYAGIFPIGLFLIGLNGYELFTGDCMTLLFLRDADCGKRLLARLPVIYLGNVLGTLVGAAFCLVCGIPQRLDIAGRLIGLFETKTSYPLLTLALLAVGCNILVCMAVYLSMRAKSAGERLILLYFPIFLFVLLGMEHLVANMVYLPLAYGLDPSLGLWPMLQNLIVVTLGNMLGGYLYARSVAYQTKE